MIFKSNLFYKYYKYTSFKFKTKSNYIFNNIRGKIILCIYA